jgi:hypothetical protein
MVAFALDLERNQADIYVSHTGQEATRYDTFPELFTDREQYTSSTELELSALWAGMRGMPGMSSYWMSSRV